jgi:NAD(P)-dependent dehydrogenase (short-subunit alcohol dehydrogenase family)
MVGGFRDAVNRRPMSFPNAVVSPGMNNLLADKTAVIYGAGGSIGSAVARTFAREGATVHLVGRTREPLEALAAEIGGHAAALDATDERAVDEHAAAVGRIDISFNLITRGDVQGRPLVEIGVDEFLGALTVGARTAFVTARAAARHGASVILHLTSGSSRGAMPGMGNTGPADAAVEALMRYLAAELGPQGVRVVGIHTAAVRGTLTPSKLAAVNPAMAGADVEAILAGVAQATMLRRAPELDQIAETAAFLASERAGAITGGIVNASCGLIPG